MAKLSELVVTQAFDMYYNPNQSYTWQEVANELSKVVGFRINENTLKYRCYERLRRMGLPNKKSELMSLATQGNELGGYLSKLISTSTGGIEAKRPQQQAVNTVHNTVHRINQDKPSSPYKPPSIFDRKFGDDLDEATKELFGI